LFRILLRDLRAGIRKLCHCLTRRLWCTICDFPGIAATPRKREPRTGVSSRPQLPMLHSARLYSGRTLQSDVRAACPRVVDTTSVEQLRDGEELDPGMLAPRRFVKACRRGFLPHSRGRLLERDQHPYLRLFSLDHTAEVSDVRHT